MLRRRASWPTRPGASRRCARDPPPRAVGRPRPTRLQLPLGLGPRWARDLPLDRPRSLGSRSREPGDACCRRPPPSGCSPPRRTPSCSPAPPRSRSASRPTSRAHARDEITTAERPIAYFSAEYGFHGSFPIYSGGLGALAGDILKEASDRAWPLAAVGLLYRDGYFRQRIDAGGWQHEYWVDTDPDRLPAALVTGEDGEPITIRVPIGDMEVTAQIWRVDIGGIPLFLLDAERPENSQTARWITSRLYIGDEDTRLAQYMLLGIGGVRALEALGHRARPRAPQRGPRGVRLARARPPRVQRQRQPQRRAGDRSRQDRSSPPTRRSRRATTRIPRSRSPDTLAHIAGTLGVDAEEIIRLGRTNPDEGAEPFGVTQFALRTSRAANGVSRRHGEVAREMWQPMWADRAVDDVPITYVTNGVHIPTWLGQPMWELLNRHLGEDWLDRATDPATWAPVDDIPAKELWAVRTAQRAAADRVRAPSRRRRPARPRRAAALRRGGRELRSRRPDDRLRAPAGDLQAAQPAAAGRRARDARRRRRPADPGPAGRQGAPARRRRQAPRAGAVLEQERAGLRRSRSPTSTTTTCGWPAGSCAAATSGSTCRARRWRRPARPA